MISALYAILGAIWILKLAIDVIRFRQQYRVSFGDGGFYELQTAIRAHSNAIEYIPIAVILLITMEMNGAKIWMLHLCGILLIIGRLLHYYALYNRDLHWRKSSMGATIISLILMITINLYYFSWGQLF